jgi:ATP-dependent Clp protease ATP-binding subunit ClpA
VLGRIPYTPRLKKVLALAAKESRALNHTYVGTEHILLGLLREGDGVPARVLNNLGLDLESARLEILKELDPNFGAEEAPPSEPPPKKAVMAPASEAEAQMAAASANRALHYDGGLFNFTPRAQQALALARREADRLSHAFVGAEHLLLGLIRLGQGVAVTVLAKLGLELENVRVEVERLLGKGPSRPSMNIPYTPRVKRILAAAAREARALNHTYVGTEHLLLGLLAESDGATAQLFKHFGVDCAKTRTEIMRELDPNSGGIHDDAQPFETTKTPATHERPDASIDTTRRYDVYCTERDQQVIYRDVLFKGAKRLASGGPPDLFSWFMDLEQRDGKRVFVSWSSIIKFCEHGVTPGSEMVAGVKPVG